MRDYLQQALRRIETVTTGITPEQLRQHPPGKWCTAEILEHLSRAFSSTAKLLDRQLAANVPAQRGPSLGERCRVWLVIEAGLFPHGRAAPQYTLPAGLPPDEALPRFRETLALMDNALTRCEERFGSHTPIAVHAIFGPLDVRRWRKFHWVHTRHHTRQIVALRKYVSRLPSPVSR
jgi:hypothetical protein